MFSYTRITGNVKRNINNMITGIARIFQQGGQSEGAKRPSGGRVWDHGREIFFLKICV